MQYNNFDKVQSKNRWNCIVMFISNTQAKGVAGNSGSRVRTFILIKRMQSF